MAKVKLKTYRVTMVAVVELTYDVEMTNKQEAKDEAIASLEAGVVPESIAHWAGDITVKSVEIKPQ